MTLQKQATLAVEFNGLRAEHGIISLRKHRLILSCTAYMQLKGLAHPMC